MEQTHKHLKVLPETHEAFKDLAHASRKTIIEYMADLASKLLKKGCRK